MSYPPPVTPGYVQQPPPGDWTPKPAKSKAVPILLGVLGVAVALVVGLLITLSRTVADGAPEAGAGPAAAVDTGATTTAVTDPGRTGYIPKISDFELTAQIVDKDCFGSAGCSVTFRPDLTYVGQPLDSDTTWLVIYEINGVEDAPQVGNIEVTGPNYEGQEEFVDTASTKSKITLKVTSVQEA